jgi:hypothetical protein
VLTAHLIDEAGQPTREARDAVIGFLRGRLLGGPVRAIGGPA